MAPNESDAWAVRPAPQRRASTVAGVTPCQATHREGVARLLQQRSHAQLHTPGESRLLGAYRA